MCFAKRSAAVTSMRRGGERVKRIVGRREFRSVEAHRREEGVLHLRRLAGLKDIGRVD